MQKSSADHHSQGAEAVLRQGPPNIPHRFPLLDGEGYPGSRNHSYKGFEYVCQSTLTGKRYPLENSFRKVEVSTNGSSTTHREVLLTLFFSLGNRAGGHGQSATGDDPELRSPTSEVIVGTRNRCTRSQLNFHERMAMDSKGRLAHHQETGE